MLDPSYAPEEAMASEALALLQDHKSEASKEEIKGKIAKTEMKLLEMQINAKKVVEEREECIRNLIKAIAETKKQRDEARHQIELLRCNFTFQTNNNIQTLHDYSYDYCRLEERVEQSMLQDAVINAVAPLSNSSLLPGQQTENSGFVFRVNECLMNSFDQSSDLIAGDKVWRNSIDGSCNELAKIFECPRVKNEEMKL